VVDKVKRRPLNDAEIWRLAQSKTNKPLPFGTCCSQVMGSFLKADPHRRWRLHRNLEAG
jgi:5-methyltetrahydropteroyltriglutamate--homocysteine methyltransferase